MSRTSPKYPATSNPGDIVENDDAMLARIINGSSNNRTISRAPPDNDVPANVLHKTSLAQVISNWSEPLKLDQLAEFWK
jgi:hypothetical protein